MEDSNNEVIKLSQKIILHFFEKNISDESVINQIKNFLENFPIIQNKEGDEFLKSQASIAQVNLTRTGEKVMILRTETKDINIDDILTVVHEYAHALSSRLSPSKEHLGILDVNTIIEEAMAVNFSEACVNEWIKDTKMFEEYKDGIVDNTVYKEESSILNTILFALNKKGLDNKAMIEYLIGDKEKFLALCSEQLGPSFSEVFSIIEKEINLKSKDPRGWGFRDRKEIQEIYKLVSSKLSDIISEEDLDELSGEDNNLTKASNRYFKTSSIIQRKYFHHLIIKMINSGEFSREDCNDLLKLDFISFDVNEIRRKIIEIKEWTKETGYTIGQLMEFGADSLMIKELFKNYDVQTGEKIDRKSKANEFITEIKELKEETGYTFKQLEKCGIIPTNIKTIKEWEKETGYTFKQLVEYGAKPIDIEKLFKSYDSQTGEKIDRKSRADEFFMKIKELTEEIGCTVKQLEEYGIKDSEIEIIKEWTKETGYKFKQLVECGANPIEIRGLIFKNYDSQTGEKIDRKSKANEFIKKRLQLIENNKDGEQKNVSLDNVEKATNEVCSSEISDNTRYIRKKTKEKKDKEEKTKQEQPIINGE